MLNILAERDFWSARWRCALRAFGRRQRHLQGRIAVQDPGDVRSAGRGRRPVFGQWQRARATRRSSRAAGAVVVDNSSAPATTTARWWSRGSTPGCAEERVARIIAELNCSTMQMLVALGRSTASAGIERINIGDHRWSPAAVRRWKSRASRLRQLLNFQQIAAAALSGADRLQPDPAHRRLRDEWLRKEEMKLVWETCKILGDDSIPGEPTAVRVPVFYGPPRR